MKPKYMRIWLLKRRIYQKHIKQSHESFNFFQTLIILSYNSNFLIIKLHKLLLGMLGKNFIINKGFFQHIQSEHNNIVTSFRLCEYLKHFLYDLMLQQSLHIHIAVAQQVWNCWHRVWDQGCVVSAQSAIERWNQ